jgi:hypothetical protein
MKKIIHSILALFLAVFLFLQFYSFNYFDFDEVIHYKSEIKEEELFDYKNKTDKLKKSVILEDTPNSIKDTIFIDKLETFGYKKTVLNKSKFDAINNLFSFKIFLKSSSSGCIYVYRDILIFKKKSRIVGMAKICFDCDANKIYGTNYKTDNFGQGGDYDRLQILLKTKK